MALSVPFVPFPYCALHFFHVLFLIFSLCLDLPPIKPKIDKQINRYYIFKSQTQVYLLLWWSILLSSVLKIWLIKNLHVQLYLASTANNYPKIHESIFPGSKNVASYTEFFFFFFNVPNRKLNRLVYSQGCPVCL